MEKGRRKVFHVPVLGPHSVTLLYFCISHFQAISIEYCLKAIFLSSKFSKGQAGIIVLIAAQLALADKVKSPDETKDDLRQREEWNEME
jgi:hypothetical protein